MIRILALLMISFLLISCANPSYLPSIGNATQFSNVTPLYLEHKPAEVAKYESLLETAEVIAELNKPSLMEKLFPTTSTIDALGKNSLPLGMAAAAAIDAIKGNTSIGAIVASAVMAGVSTVVEARSEDKTQDRVGVYMPLDASNMVFVNKDVKIAVSRKPKTAVNDIYEDSKELFKQIEKQ